MARRKSRNPWPQGPNPIVSSSYEQCLAPCKTHVQKGHPLIRDCGGLPAALMQHLQALYSAALKPSKSAYPIWNLSHPTNEVQASPRSCWLKQGFGRTLQSSRFRTNLPSLTNRIENPLCLLPWPNSPKAKYLADRSFFF